jgi:hypothetical protein
MSAMTQIQAAQNFLLEAQKRIERLQDSARNGLCDTSNPSGAKDSLIRWLDEIDDKIFDALSHLGEI